MNKVILQFWEESERGSGVRPDGCSLHMDKSARHIYVSNVYNNRSEEFIPSEYDRVVGDPIDAFISDVLYSKVKLKSSIRIHQHELNNLMSMAMLVIREEKNDK